MSLSFDEREQLLILALELERWFATSSYGTCGALDAAGALRACVAEMEEHRAPPHSILEQHVREQRDVLRSKGGSGAADAAQALAEFLEELNHDRNRMEIRDDT